MVCSNSIRYKGTRLDDEKEFYETFFGGGTRAQQVLVSASDGGNAATPLGLQAMQEVSGREVTQLQLAHKDKLEKNIYPVDTQASFGHQGAPSDHPRVE